MRLVKLIASFVMLAALTVAPALADAYSSQTSTMKNNLHVTGNLKVDGTSTATGAQTFMVAPIAPGYVLTGTSFNSTLQGTAGLGQATTFTLPDPGAASDTLATLKAANAFTGNNSFTGTSTFPAGGIILKGTSFNVTLQALAAQAQATTLTVPDAGAAAANVLLDSGVTSAITIQHISVPLTSANLLGMAAAPVNLIPAGAAGTSIVVHHAQLTMVRTSTAYASGGVVVIQQGSTATGGGTQVTGTIPASVLTTAGAATTYTVVIPVAYTAAAATGIFISNQTGAFTTGTGTATMDLWYSIK